jgi:HTH-type transcriptional regulator, sugar sensing transcriptional regulator
MGLSSYEARAYTALLSKSPATRYELARMARIPSAKIYEAVQRLYEKGLVIESADEVPLIAPLEPEILLERVREEQQSSLDTLGNLLADVKRSRSDQHVHYIWNLAGTQCAFDKAIEVIKRCREELHLAGFGSDLGALGPALEEAAGRGCSIMTVTYGPSPLRAGHVVEHGDVKGVHDRTGGRWLALASDHREVLVSYPLDGVCDSVWTNSPVLALIISKYVQEHFFKERPINPVL